jgi:cobaltochelatase CobS
MEPTNPTNNNVTLNPNDLAVLSVKELRKLSIANKVASGVWIQGASKANLITALSTGVINESASSATSATALAEVLENILQNASSPLDENRVREIASEVVSTSDRPQRIEVVRLDKTVVDAGRQHPLFQRVVDAISIREPLYLVGPAGSGKTTTWENAAKAVGLDFYPQSVTNQTSKSDLLGFIDATGAYRASIFRKAYEKGGVFHLDEVDNGNANVLAVLNSASAGNGYVSFPDAVVKQHDNFTFGASGNTFGLGKNAVYVGTNVLNGATIDRFTQIQFGYDESLERDLTAPLGQPDWVQFVQKVRSVVDTLGIRHIVSPRASIKGSKFLNVGWSREDVEAAVLWKGLDKASIDKVKANLIAA